MAEKKTEPKASKKRCTRSDSSSDDEIYHPQNSGKKKTKTNLENKSNRRLSENLENEEDETSSDSDTYQPTNSERKKTTRSVKNKGKGKKKNLEDKENKILNFQNKKRKYSQCNFLSYFKNHEMGLSCEKYVKSVKDSVMNYCKLFKIYKIEAPFDRRVTYIVWHPNNPRLMAVASHWGDVLLYDYEKDISSGSLIKGIGPGGSIQGMKFDPLNPLQIYTASMEGKFLVMNFQTKKAKHFLETNDINRWFISVDVNSSLNVMVAGDTRGNLSLLTLQGEIVLDQLQVHKKGHKVSHAEFSGREPWLLCTSSTDSTMKLWDIRKLKAEDSGVKPLKIIEHLKPINAAYFSLTNGCRLMTTDQADKIYVYRAPLWDLETVIRHPHRQFQHLTPIKAYWHPLEDIIFVGRYPHKKFPGYQEDELRTIDFFDADTGELLHQLYQSGCNGILSLNRFNIFGDTLASSYGTRFLTWKPNFRLLEKLSKKQDLLDSNEPRDNLDSDDIDWKDVMKKQTKEKLKLNSKLKVETQLDTKRKNSKKK